MSKVVGTVPLGSITTWLSGGTPNRANAMYWTGSIPWISAATLKKSRIWDSDQRITESAVRAGSKLAPQGSTLILVRGMALHNEVRAGLATRPVSFNQDVKALVPRTGLLPEFLTYSLHARRSHILNLVSSAGSGTGVLDTGLLKRLPIWVPELSEQRSIVDAIDDIESMVESLERLIAKKQAVKQGMIQQLLTGKIRLAGFDAPWGEARLGDLLSRPPRYGVNAAAVPASVGGYTYIRITDIDDSGRFTPRPKVGVRHSNAADYMLQAGDLVFARTGASVGKSYLYDPRDGQLVYAGFLINIAPDPEVLEPKYLALIAQTARYWGWVARTSVRSGQPGINGREYAQMQIMVPEIREQRAIAAMLQDADAEIRMLGERLAKARGVKQGMMQELLTGRTRLPVAEAAT
ncbi:restriction endonuclease subunit S [Rhodococcus indonesiensis]